MRISRDPQEQSVQISPQAPRGRPVPKLLALLPLLALLAAEYTRADDGAPAAGVKLAADNSDSSTDGKVAGQLQTITVTAQKRSENIKDIPTSVSAIGADQLQEHHVSNYDDLTRTTPGISFVAGTGPGDSIIEMRGVSSTSGSATVGIYVDEVAVTVKNTYDGAVEPKLFDLERVEVLRGPQGTLYGASSMGGTIRFITKQPDLYKYSGFVSTDLSTTKHGGFNHDESAVLNVPVVEGVFALRMGVDIAHTSGFIDHYVPTPNGINPAGGTYQIGQTDSTGQLGRAGVNDEHSNVFRLTGKWTPSSDLTIIPTLYSQRVQTSDTGVFYPLLGLYQQDKRVVEPGDDKVFIPSLTVNKGFDWGDLVSVTSYFHRQFQRTTDGTYYNSNIFGTVFLDSVYPQFAAQNDGIIGFSASPVYLETTTSQISQELRVSSKLPDAQSLPVTWTTGVFFSKQRIFHTDDEFINGLQSNFKTIYGYDISTDPAFGGGALPGVSYAGDSIYFAHSHTQETQRAIFGQVGYDITPKLKASAGLRYVSANNSYDFVSGGFYAFGLPNPYYQSSDFSSTTPKFAVTYEVTDKTNVYANAAKGFRLGGPTGPDPVPGGACDADYAALGITTPPLSYDSDSLWSYEIGTKGRYLDNRLSINAAAYYITWKNIQQTINLPICGFGFTTNAGDAKSYGGELELRALVTPELTLSLNAGLNHAYITRTTNPQSFAVGEQILNSPDATVTLGVDYDTDINDEYTGFVRADVDYTGRSHAYYASSNVQYHYSPEYTVVNGSVGVSSKKLTVSLYAKNLLNNKQIIQYPSVNSVAEGYTVRPLTVGVTASLKF